MDAANEMLAVRLPGETVKFPQYLKDQLLTGWYIEGVEVYRAGLDRSMCRISYVARGLRCRLERRRAAGRIPPQP